MIEENDNQDEDDIDDITWQQIITGWHRGKSPSQIAEETGLPIKLVYKRLKRTQKRIIRIGS